MQTQKWVNLAILLGSLALFVFLGKMLGVIWDLGRLPLLEDWPVPPAYAVALVLTASASFWARKNEKANSFLNEVALELSRVTWPGRKETVASAGVVVVLVAVASLILFLVDTLWGTVIRGILSL